MTLPCMKFHLSLNVSNLPRAIAFYRVLFGMEPAKCHDDYAKFELDAPPVIFSLVPQPGMAGGSLSKIGLRLADTDAVANVKVRLEAAGIPTQIPPGKRAVETRCYVADPDLNYWELSTGEDDSAHHLEPPRPAVAPPTETAAAGPVVWEHFIAAPPPDRVPHADGSVDEVRLTGTFNATLEEAAMAHLLQETVRVLRPGGKVVVHALVGDRPFASQPKLPGLAALVQRVPVQTELVTALRKQGLVGMQFVKFSEKAWFQIDGVEMREVKLIAFKPTVDGECCQVVYRGPFAQATDDAGYVYPRGQRVSIGAAAADVLRRSEAAEQFSFLQPGGSCATG
jgi:catechol 2,3-dioxygenase-like lactoylglutathione lyase family enzyme